MNYNPIGTGTDPYQSNAIPLQFYHPQEPKNAKQTLLFIHGMDSSKETWRMVIDPLKDYNIYAIDLRGYGETPMGSTEYSLEQLSADIHKFVQEHKLKDIVLVSHSMGTIVSIDYASQHPDVVKGLIIEDMDLEEMGSAPPTSPHPVASALKELSESTPYPNAEEAKKKIDELNISPGDKEYIKKNEIKEAFDHQIVITTRPYTNFYARIALSGEGSKSKFHNLKDIPVMLLKAKPTIDSKKDKSRVSDEGLKNMKNLNPGMEVITIPDSTHNIHKTQTAAFVENVKNFLKKQQSQNP